MPMKSSFTAACLTATLTACATHTATLTDAQGQTVTCEASGKAGTATHYYLREGFNDCVEAAKAQGFSEFAPQPGAIP